VLQALYHHGYTKVLAICQPHRYHRLRTLFDDYASAFRHAASVVILPVYTAGEPPCPQGTTSETLVQAMLEQGHHACVAHAMPDQLLPYIQSDSWDMVVFLGAGDITSWARTYRTHDEHGHPINHPHQSH
jgi:UDP-N-acetylmuramate--alanine ligase